MNRNLILLLMVGALIVGCSSLENRYRQPSETPLPTLSATQSPTSTVTTYPPRVFFVTTDLRQRTCPSVTCLDVGFYPEGSVVLVDSWLYDANLDECQSWAHVSNQEHWVCANYLTESQFTPDEVYNPLDYDPHVYVICGIDAPVYGMPAGTNIMYVLPIGTEVKIREMSHGVLGWAMIEDSRWVWHEYLCRK